MHSPRQAHLSNNNLNSAKNQGQKKTLDIDNSLNHNCDLVETKVNKTNLHIDIDNTDNIYFIYTNKKIFNSVKKTI